MNKNKSIINCIIFSSILLTTIELFSKKNIPILTLPQFLGHRKQLYKVGHNNLDIKNKIKRVVIVCLYSVSGGPENLCQMYASFKRLGFETHFLWVKNVSDVMKKYIHNQWYLCKDFKHLINEPYVQDYAVGSLDYDIPLNQETLVIVPELWADFAYFFEGAHKAIAWLSINNFYFGNSFLIQNFINQNKLGDCGCIHMSQAPWIQKVLESWGATPVLISDYISKIYLTEPKSLKNKNCIAFYPRKGGDLAQRFMESCNDCNFIPLKDLDRKGMIKALDSAQVYIDFGNFPGKDRTPREALARDCVIFIHNQNCATDFDSFPIDDYFRFTEDDINSGILLQKVKNVLANYQEMQEKQNFMRKQVLEETEFFEENIKNFIGNPLN